MLARRKQLELLGWRYRMPYDISPTKDCCSFCIFCLDGRTRKPLADDGGPSRDNEVLNIGGYILNKKDTPIYLVFNP